MDDPRAQRLFGDSLVAPGDLASSPYRVDRDRIVSSPFLARLAGVTQVISPGGAGLLVHNRLTHSLKVAQVGRAIAERVSASDPDLVDKLGGCDPDVVEAPRSPTISGTRRSGTSGNASSTVWPGTGCGCGTGSRATPSRTGS